MQNGGNSLSNFVDTRFLSADPPSPLLGWCCRNFGSTDNSTSPDHSVYRYLLEGPDGLCTEDYPLEGMESACEGRESEVLGRYYVAARPIAAGEQVHTTLR